MSADPKSRKRQRLSRARVVDAAIAYADAHGLAALSMRKLGQQLGVEAMSLYNHVSNKDDLLDALVDAVVEEITLPVIGGSDWRQEMRGRSLSAHEVLCRHPWATKLLVSRANVGPATLAYTNASIGCLRLAGFSYALADHALNAIDSYVYGFTLQHLNFPFQPDEYAAAAEEYLPHIDEGAYPFLVGLAREVIAGTHDGINRIHLGLDVLLDGLEALRTADG